MHLDTFSKNLLTRNLINFKKSASIWMNIWIYFNKKICIFCVQFMSPELVSVSPSVCRSVYCSDRLFIDKLIAISRVYLLRYCRGPIGHCVQSCVKCDDFSEPVSNIMYKLACAYSED